VRVVQAVEQMDERLSQFIDVGLTPDVTELDAAAGALRFAHHQVVKLAEDCLHKSRDQLLSSAYFYELSENLQTLLNDVRCFLYNVFIFNVNR